MSGITEIDIFSKERGSKNVKYVRCRKEERSEERK
jgi:hypothetical protein